MSVAEIERLSPMAIGNWKSSSNSAITTQWYILDKTIAVESIPTNITITLTISPITGTLSNEQANDISEAAIAEIRLIPFPTIPKPKNKILKHNLSLRGGNDE